MASNAAASSDNAAAPPPHYHGFEDARMDFCGNPDCEDCCGKNLAQIVSCIRSHQLKDRMLLYKIWKLALGSVPSFSNVYVVGERHTLHDMAPLRGNGYPSFITPLEYKPATEDEEDGSEEEKPLVSVKDGDFVIVLAGRYKGARLFGRSFSGNNLILGITRPNDDDSMAIVRAPNLECQGKSFVGNFYLEACPQTRDSIFTVTGSLRIAKCLLFPDGAVDPNGIDFDGKESGNLVHVAHGGGLLVESSIVGHSTRSSLYCEGRCTIHLDDVDFVGSGRGDTYRRFSKANGRFPDPLQGFSPAIAVSYASTITATCCLFEGNYGYPIQFASAAEETGSTNQHILEMSPEDHARLVVQRQEGISKKAQQRMYRKELVMRREKVAKVKEMRIKGSVRIDNSTFRNNARSPYLLDIPDSSPTTLTIAEPWFGDNSKIRKILDAEKYYDHDEARSDREAWEDYYSGNDQSLAARLFESWCDEGAPIVRLIDIFKDMNNWFTPLFAFKTSSSISDSGVESAFGMLSEPEILQLRETMLANVEERRQKICNVVARLAKSRRIEMLCWGLLTKNEAPFSMVALAVSALIAFYESSDQCVSPYRAEVLVERMQCNKPMKGVYENKDGCECDGYVSPIIHASFLLALSQDSIVEALFNLLLDQDSSWHGKRNVSEVLCNLAFVKPSLRQRVVDALTLVVRDDLELSPLSRAMIVKFLGVLHASESTEVVEMAFLNGMIEEEYCGIIRFLKLVGMPIEISNTAVDREVKMEPEEAKHATSEREIQKLTANSISRKKEEIEKHNAILEAKPPCDQCGKRPSRTSEAFPVCTRCLAATYCCKKCQRLAWPEHKKKCKDRKAQGKSKTQAATKVAPKAKETPTKGSSEAGKKAKGKGKSKKK